MHGQRTSFTAIHDGPMSISWLPRQRKETSSFPYYPISCVIRPHQGSYLASVNVLPSDTNDWWRERNHVRVCTHEPMRAPKRHTCPHVLRPSTHAFVLTLPRTCPNTSLSAADTHDLARRNTWLRTLPTLLCPETSSSGLDEIVFALAYVLPVLRARA